MVDYWKDQEEAIKLECDYEYQTEEDSIFKSFNQEIKNMPPPISKIFSFRSYTF